MNIDNGMHLYPLQAQRNIVIQGSHPESCGICRILSGSLFLMIYLSGDADKQSGSERYVTEVEDFNNVDNPSGIYGTGSRIFKDCDQHMLLHVKRARIECERKPGIPEINFCW